MDYRVAAGCFDGPTVGRWEASARADGRPAIRFRVRRAAATVITSAWDLRKTSAYEGHWGVNDTEVKQARTLNPILLIKIL